jgi:vacuolar-type H+-ATPase subunit I/STV1
MPVTIENKLYNHQTMFNVFGLNKTKEAIRRLKKVAIFEGEKSVLKCEDYYGDNNFSVASCSSQITNFHRDILLSLEIEEVIICLDKFRNRKSNESEEKYQEEIINYQEKLLKFASKFTPYVRTYIVWDDFEVLDYKDSPCDKGRDILEQLMKCKYEIKTNDEVG